MTSRAARPAYPCPRCRETSVLDVMRHDNGGASLMLFELCPGRARGPRGGLGLSRTFLRAPRYPWRRRARMLCSKSTNKPRPELINGCRNRCDGYSGCLKSWPSIGERSCPGETPEVAETDSVSAVLTLPPAKDRRDWVLLTVQHRPAASRLALGCPSR